MIHRRGRELVSTQHADFHLGDGLVLQLGLILQVNDVVVHVVIVKLVLDVERSVVANVVLVRIERTRRVQRVRIRVDIEVTRHSTRHGVGRLVAGTRSLLLTVAGISNHVQRHLLANVVVGIDVGGVTLHVATLRPSRVIQERERSIVLSLIRTRAHTDRVVHLDGVGEQLIEPVRIAILSLEEVSIHSLLCVGKTEAAIGLIVLIHKVIHLTEDTACAGAIRVHEREETTLHHLTIDRHLLL